MNLLKLFKHVFLFSIFFTIFYIETVTVGGVKFAYIWKGVLMILILSKLIFTKKSGASKKYIIYGYLFNFKKLLTLSTFSSFLPSLLQLSRSIIFPLLISYFNTFFTKEKSLKFIKLISLYIVISTIPFLLNLIQPLKQGYDLSIYGVEASGFVGVFQNAHSASMSIAFSLICIVFFLLKTQSNRQKGFYIVLLAIGIYALIQTYVRTGLAMFLVGMFMLFLYKKKIYKLIKLIPLLGLLTLGLYFYYQSNEILQMRFQERNIYQNTNPTIGIDNIGSGRFTIVAHAINNWWSEGGASIFIGLGEELAREKMTKTKGSAIFAHNGFVEILQTDGILGVLLYLNFIYFIYRSISKYENKNSGYYKLILTLFIVYLVGMFFQGGDNVFIYGLLALSLSLLKKENKNSFFIKKYN